MKPWRRNTPLIPDDTGEAASMRKEALEKLGDAARIRIEHEKRAPALIATALGLIERREKNHFMETLFPGGIR